MPRARQRSTNSKQSRLLPTPGLGDDADDLPVPVERPRERGLERRHLVAAADEAREAARARDVEARAQRADALELEDADRLAARPSRANGAEVARARSSPSTSARRVLGQVDAARARASCSMRAASPTVWPCAV